MRGRGIEAYPFLQPDTFVDSTNAILKAGNTATIPLSGLASSLTVLCNEQRTTVGYRADSLGFRNPPDIWEPIHPQVALVGDSFTHGFCRPEDETIAGLLRSTGATIVNTGLTGVGPLAELGIIREFLPAIKPKHVYWLFYEGNDLIDITSERRTPLYQYLKPGYTQHLLDRRREIADAIRSYSDSMMSAYHPPTTTQKVWAFLILRNLRTATGLYRKPKIPPQGDEREEMQILEATLNQASTEIQSWGGHLHLVYLPERRRFNKRTAPVVGEHHDPLVVQQRVTQVAGRLGIPMIDAAHIFAEDPKPTELWNARRYHYNARGYALIAKAIIADLAAH